MVFGSFSSLSSQSFHLVPPSVFVSVFFFSSLFPSDFFFQFYVCKTEKTISNQWRPKKENCKKQKITLF